MPKSELAIQFIHRLFYLFIQDIDGNVPSADAVPDRSMDETGLKEMEENTHSGNRFTKVYSLVHF